MPVAKPKKQVPGHIHTPITTTKPSPGVKHIYSCLCGRRIKLATGSTTQWVIAW